MKKVLFVLICMVIAISGCEANVDKNDGVVTENPTEKIMKIGDGLAVTGMVEYSDEPSDIGQEYCFVTGTEEIKYRYTDIYGEESEWKSNVFFTKGDDTALLKEYAGSVVTVSGIFDAESHGIPYITDITVSKD